MSRSGSSSARRGTVSLEFGVIGAMLFATIIGCIDLGRFIGTRTALRAAVAEVVRKSMADQAFTGCAVPEAFALSRVSLLRPERLTICVTRLPGSLTVTAEYTFTFVTPLLGAGTRVLQTSATSPV